MAEPVLIEVAFATTGDKTVIPDPVQGDGSVSFEQGYTISYSTPVSSGGRNVERATMNYLFNILTDGMRQYQNKGTPDYYAAISAGAGYSKYAEVLYGSPKKKYQSLMDANTDLPTVTASWYEVPLGGNVGNTTGDTKTTYKTTADSGWIMGDDGTIGSAASGATTRANADTQALYTLFWTNCNNTICPVSGGRGASATADFNANKTLRIPLLRGRALGIAGAGSGLTSRALGATIGAETVALVAANNGPHTHTVNITDPGHTHIAAPQASIVGSQNATADKYYGDGSGTGTPTINPPTGSATTGITATTVTQGSGTPHDNMQPSGFQNIMIKL